MGGGGSGSGFSVPSSGRAGVGTRSSTRAELSEHRHSDVRMSHPEWPQGLLAPASTQEQEGPPHSPPTALPQRWSGTTPHTADPQRTSP